MDSSRLPWLALAGWLFLTAGLWGWAGVAAWWVWPLSAGVALLLVAAAGKWLHVQQLRVLAAKRPIPGEVET